MLASSYYSVKNIDEDVEIRVVGRRNFVAIAMLADDDDSDVKDYIGSTFSRCQLQELIHVLEETYQNME